MEITFISLVAKAGYVIVVGATSIVANTLIQYHHDYKSKVKTTANKRRGGGRIESKSEDQVLKELRGLSQAD